LCFDLIHSDVENLPDRSAYVKSLFDDPYFLHDWIRVIKFCRLVYIFVKNAYQNLVFYIGLYLIKVCNTVLVRVSASLK